MESDQSDCSRESRRASHKQKLRVTFPPRSRRTMEHLNALASICESAERMPVLQKPIVTYPATLNQYLTTCSTQSSKYVHQSQQYFSSLCNYSTTLSLPTPPITPISSAVLQQGEQSTNEIFPGYPNPIVHCKRPMNPVIRNVISYASYMQYLDENWPEKCSRRGSAVIRASLYTQISDCLKGGVATARFRYWVKKSGFFLIEKLQQDGSYAPCIAVPLNPNKKSDVAVTKCTRSYRLVAKLEEFVHLIGEYHNDSIGHYGIRKTYQMVKHIKIETIKNHIVNLEFSIISIIDQTLFQFLL